MSEKTRTILFNSFLMIAGLIALCHLLVALMTGVATAPRHDGLVSIAWDEAPLPYVFKIGIMAMVSSVFFGLLIYNLRGWRHYPSNAQDIAGAIRRRNGRPPQSNTPVR